MTKDVTLKTPLFFYFLKKLFIYWFFNFTQKENCLFMNKKIGFLVNPIAGMGGRVGLKGTDGVVEKAKSLGAKPVAPVKAEEMLSDFFKKYSDKHEIIWYTSSGEMGENILKKIGFSDLKVVHNYKNQSFSEDTQKTCKRFLDEKVDLVVFCGGDGTARDVFNVIQDRVPLLGIPSGVKMHSGVFAVNTEAGSCMLHEFLNETLTIGDVEIMDLDEERYRKGDWNIRLFGVAKGIVEPTYIQVGKSVFESVSDEEVKNELYEHIEDEIDDNPDVLFLFGSGGTIEYIAGKLGVENTLLGVDAVFNKKNIGRDLNEKQILKLLDKYSKVKVILSPIGAQGFILGRGNLQLSPDVVRKIGFENIIVISTPAKIKATPVIRVDTGDKELDNDFFDSEFMMVVIGYRLSRVVKIQ